MEKQKKKQNGITLIALIVSIIVMLILAGVSLSMILGDNGIIKQAQYASFLSEMAAVEEAVQMWGVEHYDDENHSIPAKGIAQNNDVNNSERLSGEIGYYREWSRTNIIPAFSITESAENFNNKFSVELISYPAGVEDLYYLDNETLSLSKNKKYFIDATNSMVYSLQGITLNGVRCYSLEMAKAIMTGAYDTPSFASAEVGGSSAVGGKKAAGNTEPQYIEDEDGNLIENPNYNPNGFQIIGDYSNGNIYKLYNNGDLYGKGKKGFLLNNTKTEIDAINHLLFQELNISAEIPGASSGNIKIIPGNQIIFVIDSNDELWAWGYNENYNLLGLTMEEKVSYTGYNPIKLNVNNQKVSKVFANAKNTFVVTKGNELYVCGYNRNGELGIGSSEDSVDTFTRVLDITDAQNIINITNLDRDQTITYMLKKDTTDENNVRNRLYATGVNSNKFQEVIPSYSSNIEKICSLNSNGVIFLSENKLYTYYFTSGSYNEYKVTDQEYTLNRCWFGTFGSICLFDITINSVRQLWYRSTNSSNYLGATSYAANTLKRLDTDFISGLTLSNVKDIYINNTNIFYLTNDNKIFATGESTGLGVNNGTYVSGFVNLTATVSLPNITQVICNDEVNKSGFSNCIIFVGNGKRLITGNAQVMFGENVLQKTWKLIASNVKKFKADTTNNALGYIDTSGNLMVLGEDSRYLGLSVETATPQYEFKMVTDAKDSATGNVVKDRLKGKVEDFDFAQVSLFIRTNEDDNNNLYTCGLLRNNKWYIYTFIGLYVNTEATAQIGPSETLATGESNAYTPTKILTDVKMMDMSGLNRFAITNDDELYVWGKNDGYSLGRGQVCEPTLLESDVLDVSKITKIKASTYQSYIIETVKDESNNLKNEMFVSGINHVTGCTGTGETVYPFGTFDVDEFIDGNMVKDIVSIDGTTTYIILTVDGDLYGWGYADKLGLNRTDHTIIRTPEKISTISNVDQIIGCSGYFACIKKDGSVWATGSNSNGVMGRWIGIDRNTENSRYKTAFTWVECPELEI